MKVVVQRCSDASVTVNNNVVGKIDTGLMLLVGFTETDTIIEAVRKYTYDLLILDLQFADDDSKGISVLDFCEKSQYDGYIIFMSKIREAKVLKNAIGKNVLWRMEKPVQKNDLKAGMQKFFRNIEDILGKQIVFISSTFKYSEVHYANGQIESIPESLNKIEKKLEESIFVRISRKHIVNLNFISKVDEKNINTHRKYKVLLLVEKREFCVSRNRQKLFREKWHGYLVESGLRL